MDVSLYWSTVQSMEQISIDAVQVWSSQHQRFQRGNEKIIVAIAIKGVAEKVGLPIDSKHLS